MKIDKFNKSDFGTLTTITSEKTGVVMFIAAEVGKMWGHTNMKQVVNRILNKSEYMVINKSNYALFFKELVSNNVLPSKAQRIQLITESAVYKLALASNLEKAKPFRDWVAAEILPSIRKNGYYSLADQTSAIMIHTNTSIQKMNSKDINSKIFTENGKDSVIEYNRKSCLLHTGKTPSQIKEIGKNLGLKSKDRNSAKEVLRHSKPELACAMSFTDSLVHKGFDLNTVSELSLKAAVPLFQGMIELGITPSELYH
jgi:prophage antirepressor-like protein